jgi:hypothetical protein
MSVFTDPKQALEMLNAAGVFYFTEIDDPDDEPFRQMLNMNDTFAWALAYGATVPDGHLCEVAALFWRYGSAGLHYWCTIHPDEEQRIGASEFEDVQRGIDFVRHEEAIRKQFESSSQRAYHKAVYTLGERVSDNLGRE